MKLENIARSVRGMSDLTGLCVVAGIVSITYLGCRAIDKYSANKYAEARVQELRTVEVIAEKYADKMSPEQFKDYLKTLNLNQER